MREGVIIVLAIGTVIAALLLTILASRSRVGWRDRKFWCKPEEDVIRRAGTLPDDDTTWAGEIVFWLFFFWITGGIILLAIHFNWYGLGN